MKGEYYINLSGIYDGFLHEVNCTDISGTNCYCSEMAKVGLRKRLFNVPTSALHFIDSGNYHYLSYFFLERVEEDFALILLDHHPDFLQPSFGDILSCGGWVKNAWEDFPNLKKVYMVGVDEKLYEGISEMPKEVKLIPVNRISDIPLNLPVYISLDKDVLAKGEAFCDWDQGDMTMEDLTFLLNRFMAYRILGVDVCGEKKENPTSFEKQTNEALNNRIRQVILQESIQS